MPDVDDATSVAGVVVVTPDVHVDERGLFVETWRRQWVPGSQEMVQANRADRVAGSVVGLHFHRFQADYWYVPAGRARVVLHDLRLGSPTEGVTLTLDLGAPARGGPLAGPQTSDGPPAAAEHDHRGVYIPPGVAHGFAAVTDLTITYMVDHCYDPADELGVAWDDPAIGADWGVDDPVLSGRDRANPNRDAIDPVLRPRWSGGE